MQTYSQKRPVRVVRSDRKTVSFAVTGEGEIVFRAPKRVTDAQIAEILREYDGKLETMFAANAARREKARENALSLEDVRALGQKALAELAPRVADFAGRMGVTVTRLTVRSQKTRWGSCSSRGAVHLNCLLLLCPREVQDYVIVHELCHRREMNHSARFWREVESVMPNYRVWRDWLKENGREIIARMPTEEKNERTFFTDSKT